MKCPYCFRINRFRIQKKKGSRIVYYCSLCKSEIPKVFLESPETPFTKIGMIGYSGHGKTVYNISMLYLLNSLHAYWNNFFFETLDDTSHIAMHSAVPDLKEGRMFMRTNAIFPRPTFLRLNNTPLLNTQFVSLFDTGGRLFDNLDMMTRKGRYLAHANVIFFFISLTEEDMLDNWNIKIMKLLDRYINVVYSRYGVKTKKKQNIAFILTKSDELIKLNGEYKLPENVIINYENGTIEKYRHFEKSTLENMKNSSDAIESWLRSNNCNSFINFAKNHFKNISFVMTSSIGSTPENGKLKEELNIQNPKCVLDPLLWAMHISN